MFLLVQRFGELMRKLWNPRNFKAHVSPHEMLQAVVLCSKKNFQITKQGKRPEESMVAVRWNLGSGHSEHITARHPNGECSPFGSLDIWRAAKGY